MKTHNNQNIHWRDCCCRVKTKRHVTTSIRKLKPAKPMILLKLYLFFVICKYIKPVRSAYAHRCTHQPTHIATQQSLVRWLSVPLSFHTFHSLALTATLWQQPTDICLCHKLSFEHAMFLYDGFFLDFIFWWILIIFWKINTLSKNALILG